MEISYVITPKGEDLESLEALTLFTVKGESIFVPRVGDTIPYICVALPKEARNNNLTKEQLSGLYKVEEVRLLYLGIEVQLKIDPDDYAVVGKNIPKNEIIRSARESILCKLKGI